MPVTTPGGVVQYYDEIAERYDQERFGNSYGAYVDSQERGVLRQWLAPINGGKILDLACGTGRLLDFATHGLDASEAMLRIAKSKYPSKPTHWGPGIEIDRFGTAFDAIFCNGGKRKAFSFFRCIVCQAGHAQHFGVWTTSSG